MRWRGLLYVSLGVNLFLIGLWVIVSLSAGKSRHTSPGLRESVAGSSSTNLVVRRQIFSWQELESSDYPQYIANLRAIHCPEQTIRDIIIADVNALYARKRATELVTSEQQWWRTEPDSNVVAVASAKARLLDDERRSLLGKLLGPNWEAGDMTSIPRPSQPGVVLDGALLGSLPNETKAAVQEVNLASQERLESYVAARRAEGKDPDPEELAKLRQQTRADLAKILSPPQLEEYLLRYSQNASNLRGDFGTLKYFYPTQDEFRNVFRATDTLDQQIQLLADATDPSSVSARKALEDQREAAIKVALGTKRYEEYRLLQDPVYRDAMATALAAGTPDAVKAIYAVNLTALSEQERIQADPDLTPEQKAVKLKELELQQLQANTVAAGGDLPPDTLQPPASSSGPPKRTHVVRPGDTPAVLALVYGVPVSALKAANPRVNFGRLQPGQALTIPPTLLPNPLP